MISLRDMKYNHAFAGYIARAIIARDFSRLKARRCYAGRAIFARKGEVSARYPSVQ